MPEKIKICSTRGCPNQVHKVPDPSAEVEWSGPSELTQVGCAYRTHIYHSSGLCGPCLRDSNQLPLEETKE